MEFSIDKVVVADEEVLARGDAEGKRARERLLLPRQGEIGLKRGQLCLHRLWRAAGVAQRGLIVRRKRKPLRQNLLVELSDVGAGSLCRRSRSNRVHR